MKTRLTAFAVLLCMQLTAQEKETTLDPVTVTASLVSKPVSQTGRNIITISGDQFSNFPIQSVDELLRYLPGVEMQMRGPMGSQSDIVLRGGTFQQVLVILDGVRLNDPNTGHFNSYIPIAPAEIDHIEILKGASSAIYGSEAVGGVIHIITKTFAARQQGRKTQIMAGATGGEYQLFNANAGGFYQQDKTAVGGGWLSNNTEGQLQRGTRGYVYANTASASVSHFLNEKWQLAFRSSYDNRRFAAQNFYTTFASDTASEKVATFWSQARIAYTGQRHKLNIDAGWKAVTDEYRYNGVSIANENKSKLLQATLTDEWKVGASAALVSGIQFINKSIRSNDRGNHRLSQAAAFFVWNQRLGQWTINPALRIDWNERGGTELVPQVNLSWKQNRLQLRGSAGKTIRDADFTERFNNYNKPIVASGGRIGDPDLKAERSFSYEAGADHFTTDNLKISGTFFQRFHRRLIDYTPTPYADMPRKDNLVAGGTYALAKNIARVTTTGAEIDIQYSRRLGNSRLYATAGLVWLRSKSSDAAPSFYVSSHARFLVNFSADYSGKIFFASLNGVYKDRDAQTAAAIHAEVSKEYLVLNAKAGVIAGRRFRVFVAMNNVTDKAYSDLLG
ncbi:MAG: TonB-dependent receptor plug domain-containing protein, partial [Chitinophagaceae bacterium]